jgi:hypothetical protein
LEILYQSRGFFSGEQAGHIASSIARPKDRMKAIMIMEPVENIKRKENRKFIS